MSPAAADDDEKPTIDLVRRAQSGDAEAREALASRYLPRLTRWATGRLPRHLRSTRDTGDLVQEAITNALRNLATFEPSNEGAFLHYLARAVSNQIKDLYRSKQRRPARVEMPEEVGSNEPTPLDLAIGTNNRERYERALATLREEEQTVVFLRLELGLSFQEVARQQQKPSADAARMFFTRAVKQLAAEMSVPAPDRAKASRAAKS